MSCLHCVSRSGLAHRRSSRPQSGSVVVADIGIAEQLRECEPGVGGPLAVRHWAITSRSDVMPSRAPSTCLQLAASSWYHSTGWLLTAGGLTAATDHAADPATPRARS